MTNATPRKLSPVESTFRSRTLAELAELVDYGLTASAVERTSGPRFLRITDIQGGQVNWDAVPSCDCTASDEAKYRLSAGDIVFARTGATTGKSFLISSPPESAVFASYLIRVRPTAAVWAPYLAHFFQTPNYWRQITSRSSGTAQPGVNATKLKSLVVPLPPLEEQRRIAAILDKADEIRRKRQQAIELTDELLRSVFLDMFGDPVTNPKALPTKTLGVVAVLHAGNSLPPGEPFVGQHDGFLLAKVAEMNLAGNEHILSTAREWSATPQGIVAPAGSVVFPKRGGAIATNKKRVLGRPALLDPNMMAVEAKPPLTARYLHHWFRLFDLSTLTSGSAVPQLNKQDLSPLKIAIPSVDVLARFEAAVTGIESLAVRQRAAGEEAGTLFSSLQQRAFAGEL